MSRFQNQISLPNFGTTLQNTIKETSVLIVGAGGLGCPVALNIAALGVGRIGIADFDVVEISNLNRQLIYGINDIGNSKTEVITKYFENKYQDIIWEKYSFKIDSNNAEEIIRKYDFIFETSDDLNTKFLINDICIKLHKKLIIGSVFQLEGQICCFDFENQKNHSFRNVFSQNDNPIYKCADQGTIGTFTNIIGSMMCAEFIKNLQKKDNFGKLLIYKWSDYSTHIFDIPKTQTQ